MPHRSSTTRQATLLGRARKSPSQSGVLLCDLYHDVIYSSCGMRTMVTEQPCRLVAISSLVPLEHRGGFAGHLRRDTHCFRASHATDSNSMNGGNHRHHPPSSGQHHHRGKRSRSFGTFSINSTTKTYAETQLAVTVERAALDVERGRHSDRSTVPVVLKQDLLLTRGSALVARGAAPRGLDYI